MCPVVLRAFLFSPCAPQSELEAIRRCIDLIISYSSCCLDLAVVLSLCPATQRAGESES